MDTTAGGSVMNKTAEEACDLYEEMATSHYQVPSDRNMGRRVAGVIQVIKWIVSPNIVPRRTIAYI